MSHFAVLVKVKKERLESHEDIVAAVEAMMLPYQENNMEDCTAEYLSFVDMTEEVEKSKNDVIEVGGYMAKEHPEGVGKTLLEFYGDYDTYVDKYHGYKKDKDTGKYGYWQNHNAHWDWYQIGGRWAGLLPGDGAMGERSWANKEKAIPPNYSDIVKRKDLDVDKMHADAVKKAEVFWQDYQQWLAIKDMARTEVPEEKRWLDHDIHGELYSLGIRKCTKKSVPMVDAEGKPVMEEDGRQKWTKSEFSDDPFTKEDLLVKYKWYFEWSTFAVLDDNGWEEKGEMGWWGCSSDTAEDRATWGTSYFERFLANEDPETTLVIVDAHI